jgi:hypothetical protein
LQAYGEIIFRGLLVKRAQAAYAYDYHYTIQQGSEGTGIELFLKKNKNNSSAPRKRPHEWQPFQINGRGFSRLRQV